jgi:hypothetical protein
MADGTTSKRSGTLAHLRDRAPLWRLGRPGDLPDVGLVSIPARTIAAALVALHARPTTTHLWWDRLDEEPAPGADERLPRLRVEGVVGDPPLPGGVDRPGSADQWRERRDSVEAELAVPHGRGPTQPTIAPKLEFVQGRIEGTQPNGEPIDAGHRRHSTTDRRRSASHPLPRGLR